MRSRSLAAHEAADREVVGSVRAFEETEPLSVRPLFWAERGLRPARSSAHKDWVVFLLRCGVLTEEVQWRSRLAEAYGVARVPRWVNDLCCALRTSKRMYEQGRLTAMTPDQDETVRLVSRAVRAAQRAPAFRIALTVKCRELRETHLARPIDRAVSVEDGDCLVPLGRAVLAWLRARDWSDARPGAAFR